MPASNGVASRVLLPIAVLVAGLTSAMLLFVWRISDQVREDYLRYTVTAAGGHVGTILDLTAADLTTARLIGNYVVEEAKQSATRDAIAGCWSHGGLKGVIARADGSVVHSTLDGEAMRALLAQTDDGYCVAPAAGGALHGFAQRFPLWQWRVITVAPSATFNPVRREVALLLPLMALGALVMTAGLFTVLWRNLSRPLGELAAAVAGERELPATGIGEFDRLGAAVNGALARVNERTEELTAELGLRRKAEAALREREEHIRLLLDSTAEGIYGVDTAGICTFCNPSCLKLLGCDSEDQLLGKNMHALVHHSRRDGSPYPEDECRIYLAYREGQGVHVDDEVFWRRDGSSFPAEYWSTPVIVEGTVAGAVVAFFDITERAGLELQLRHAQKMEAVGRLAGGIAHDFNNLLMAIVGYASLGCELAPAGSKLRQYNAQVLAAAEKAADLTRQILAFSRKQMLSPAPVDVNGIVLGMGKIIQRLLGEDIEVALSLSAGQLVALADRGQIEQVLMNLCTNARDAMPRGGRLAIGTQGITCDRAGAALHGLEEAGRYALVTVSDTGLGMDEATRQRIFEPFFTTKELGKGTGLGLSIVYGIVRQHHGQINVYSEPGRGTTFRIYLPLTSESPGLEPPPAAPAPRGGSETVLLAEDNDDVRALATSVLEEAGYRVLAAADGEEAVRLFGEHAGEIGLCLFDSVMPRRSGREALDAIRAQRPEVRAVFMSGYAADVAGGPRARDRGVPVLTKPLLPRDLLRCVREALDA